MAAALEAETGAEEEETGAVEVEVAGVEVIGVIPELVWLTAFWLAWPMELALALVMRWLEDGTRTVLPLRHRYHPTLEVDDLYLLKSL